MVWFFLVSFSVFSQDVRDVGFLSGCWRLNDGEAVQRESWTMATDTQMIGLSHRTTKSETTTEAFEYLRIEKMNDGSLGYFPYIDGKRAAEPFIYDKSLSNKEVKRAVFVNDKNDFPKRITYVKINDKTLHIMLSGAKKSKPQVLSMKPEDCNSAFKKQVN